MKRLRLIKGGKSSPKKPSGSGEVPSYFKRESIGPMDVERCEKVSVADLRNGSPILVDWWSDPKGGMRQKIGVYRGDGVIEVFYDGLNYARGLPRVASHRLKINEIPNAEVYLMHLSARK